MATISVAPTQAVTVQLVTAPAGATIAVSEGIPGPVGPAGTPGIDGLSGEDGLDASVYTDAVDPGQLVADRALFSSTTAPVSQKLVLSYFTAARAETWTNANVVTGATVPSAITLSRLGLYVVDSATEDLTLVASTVNDTALFATQSSLRTKAFAIPYNSSKGARYALGILVVATTCPNFLATASGGVAAITAAEKGIKPRQTGELAGQADLPSTITNSALATADRLYYGRLS